MGCVNTDLPFVPTVLMWVSASLLNLITPNGIGGTALQFDYLRKQDVPAASSGSALALSGTVGYALQLAILAGAASLTSSQLNLGSGHSGSLGLVIVAVVAAAIGALLLFPKVRGKVVPQAKRAAGDIWAVLRTPKKALQLFGGALVGNLAGAAVLGLCLLAFGQHLAFAQLLVVQLGAGFLASLAPVPGGIGVQEAALTGALTGFGVASAPALAGVLVYRGLTFVLPPIVGFFTLRWLRKRGYV
jgi:undecaprenyl-diphosphatase